jgi:hypothetical protein
MNPFTKPRIAIYMAGIFLAGGLSGGFTGYHLARHRFFRLPPPQNMSEHILSRFNSDLRLSAEQDIQIKPVVEEACNKLHLIHEKAMEDGGQIMNAMDDKVITFLNPEQTILFKEKQQERKGPPKDHDGSPGSHPPGPPPQGDGDRPDHKPEPQHN